MNTTSTIITSLFLYTDGSVEIKIKEPSGEETTFKLSAEKFTGMDMDARYVAAKQRAASYIACLEKEDMTDPEYRPFPMVIKGTYDPICPPLPFQEQMNEPNRP